METSKIVGDILVNIEYQKETSIKTCFVVFSSHEKHTEVVIDCIETVFEENYHVKRLDKHLKSGDSQLKEIEDNISSCCFAVVILDGLRPNVLFEYGILKGLKKPCIVLLAKEAKVDIENYYLDGDVKVQYSPIIDMDKHFSDVKDRFYITYDRHDPKKIREILKEEYVKQKDNIEKELINSIFPYSSVIKKELEAHLTTIADAILKPLNKSDEDSISNAELARKHIERLAEEYKIELPLMYYLSIIYIYERHEVFDKAIYSIDKALEVYFQHPLLLNSKADILITQGEFEKAIIVLNDFVNINPEYEPSWHNLGILYDRKGELEKAIECYKKAINLNSGCSSVHFHYGIILYQIGEFEKSRKQFIKARRIKPKEQEYWLWEARSLYSLNKRDKSLKIIQDLLDSNPENPNAWYVLGLLENNSEKQLDYYKKVLEIDPKHAGALCSTAAQLSNLGEYDEALEIFNSVDNICINYNSCTTLAGNIYKTMSFIGKEDAAYPIIEKMLENNPNDEDLLKLKVFHYNHIGNYEKALDILNSLLSTNPKDGDLIYDTACNLVLLERLKEGMLFLQRAISIDKKYYELALKDDDLLLLRSRPDFEEKLSEDLNIQ